MDTTDLEVELFVQPDRLEQRLKKLHNGAAFTRGEYISDVPGYVNDMEWNFYDELHRYYVHNTYHDMLKIFSGKTFSVNLVRKGNWPIFIQVANAKISKNIFYQTMTILGIFYIHQIVKFEQLDREVRLTRQWYTMSHWIFKPLHFLLNRSLLKLQIKQDIEDNEQIRHRRLYLRDQGYSFTTDDANFTNSNHLSHNVIFPKCHKKYELPLSAIPQDEAFNVTIGILELLIKRENNGIKIWPGICPHEGAALNKSHLCNETINCPWHGKRFTSTLLNEGDKAWKFMDFEVWLENRNIIVKRINNISSQKKNTLLTEEAI